MKVIKWCYERRLILTIDFAALLLFILIGAFSGHLKKQTYNQQEAQRWAADKSPYHQVSAFWPESAGINKESISGIRASLQRALTEASLTGDNLNGRLWADTFSARTTDDVSRTTARGTTGKEDVGIIGVGGDFFLFHPMKMISGSCFSERDVMDDRVVIDRELAWSLYGGYKIEGQRIRIGNTSFTIAGVFEPGDSKIAKKAADGKCHLFMDYAAFHKLYGETPVTVYEAVLPNPVKSFALSKLQDAVGGEEATAELLDNTSRFTAAGLMTRFSDIPSLLMQKSPVVYPYWENEMRGLEWKLFLLLMLRLLLILPPLVSAIFWTVLFFRRVGNRYIRQFFADWKERIRRRLYERPISQKADFEEEDF